MTKLLYRVNCMLVVLVKHRVDSVTNAENFMMHINYAISHPTLEQNLHELLKLDMQILSTPIKTRKFCKSETIDEMMFTAASLSIICQYLTGLILLLTGRLQDAHDRFCILRHHIKRTKPDCIVSGFTEILDNRLFVTCRALMGNDFDAFYLDRDEAALERINSKLEEVKEPLINHRYFITIDKPVHENSLFRALLGVGFPVIRSRKAQMGIVPPYQAISSFSRDRPARASM